MFETRELVGSTYKVMQSAPTLSGEISTYILIVNCCNDERVKSAVLEQRDSLERSGYSIVIGLRDLYPSPLADLNLIESRLQYGVPTKGIPTKLYLSVSEIEAWFIQEHSHFAKIHADFTTEYILRLTGVDVAVALADSINQPSRFIDEIYASRGLRYAKKKKQIQRTVDALDYTELYLTCASKLPHLARFVSCVETAIS